jgi:hypothetical protein
MASDATNVFAFAGDYAMGVLCSSLHSGWAWVQSSTIRQDIRYTPTSAFETFPWPAANERERAAVEKASRALIECRSRICGERDVGLTKLLHEMEEGMHSELDQLQSGLDRAVVDAYGWPLSSAEDAMDSNRLLLELNKAITAGEVDYTGPSAR